MNCFNNTHYYKEKRSDILKQHVLYLIIHRHRSLKHNIAILVSLIIYRPLFRVNDKSIVASINKTNNDQRLLK